MGTVLSLSLNLRQFAVACQRDGFEYYVSGVVRELARVAASMKVPVRSLRFPESRRAAL